MNKKTEQFLLTIVSFLIIFFLVIRPSYICIWFALLCRFNFPKNNNDDGVGCRAFVELVDYIKLLKF